MKILGRVVIVMSVAASTLAAQAARTVQPERPTVATHAGTVAPGFLELEWGGEYADGPTLGFPFYFKLGLKKNAQLGMMLPFSKPTGGDLGLGDLGFAVKWRLVDKNPLLGDFAIQPGVTLPTAEGSSESTVSFLLISSRMLGKVALDLNAGIVTGAGAGTMSNWTASFGGPFSGKMGWVAEIFGTSTSGASQTSVLAGPTWRIRPSMALDVGVIAPMDPGGDIRIYFGGVNNFGRLVGK